MGNKGIGTDKPARMVGIVESLDSLYRLRVVYHRSQKGIKDLLDSLDCIEIKFLPWQWLA